MSSAWGAIDDGASRQALGVAVAEGVDFFDTADNYGDGHSEVRLGEVLSALGRNKPYVATKMGWRANASDYTIDSFRRCTEQAGLDRCPARAVCARPKGPARLNVVRASRLASRPGVRLTTVGGRIGRRSEGLLEGRDKTV
jgi:hypothetical protein